MERKNITSIDVLTMIGKTEDKINEISKLLEPENAQDTKSVTVARADAIDNRKMVETTINKARIRRNPRGSLFPLQKHTQPSRNGNGDYNGLGLYYLPRR